MFSGEDWTPANWEPWKEHWAGSRRALDLQPVTTLFLLCSMTLNKLLAFWALLVHP